MTCRWRVLCWFVAFTIRFRKQNRRSGDDRLSDASINEDSTSSETHSITSFDDRNTHYENLLVTADVVRSVLYSTKDNVLCLHEVFRQVCFKVKSQSPFLLPMMHRAASISVSMALGHASANAVKATAGGWSTGSSASLTFPLHSHISSARREGSEYHC